MKRSVVLLSLVLVMAVSAFASAATYQQRLPELEGYFNSYDIYSRSDNFDFGSKFTSVNSVSVRIIGQATDSQDWMLVPDPMNPNGPPNYTIMYFPVQFSAGCPDANQYYGTALMGQFNDSIPVDGIARNALVQDGFGTVQLFCIIPYTNGPKGFATVNEAYLVVDGEMASVPEPSSLLALAGGLLSLGGLARRRK